MRRFAVAVLLAVLVVVPGAMSANAESTPFALVFGDEGPFMALAPMCAAGTAVELEQTLTNGWLTTLRRFDCADGDSVLARTWLLWGDPAAGYEEGAWRILGGSGAYGRLRGKGTYVRAPFEETGSIAEVWRGLVDLDDVAPQVTVTRASVSAQRQPGDAYVVRLAFRARDASGSPVSFLVTVRSSILLAAKYGSAGPGPTSIVLKVSPRTGERLVRLEISAIDHVGNERVIGRVQALPRS